VDAWALGLVLLVVVGLGVIVVGALWDRARNRRRAEEMLSPPERVIPQFRPDAPAPRYLSDLQARRPPESGAKPPLAGDDQIALQRRLDDGSHPVIPTGYASADFVTDRATGWAVLDGPAVLVCADPVVSIRELLGVLEQMALSTTPLVVVAPEMAAEVLKTLEVNHIQRRLELLVVLAREASERRAVVEACFATPTERADRQAGYVPSSVLGRCDRWVSTARASHLLPWP
jgi:hypothetical protein